MEEFVYFTTLFLWLQVSLANIVFVKEGNTAKLVCPMRTEIFPTTWNGPNSEYPIADGQHISRFFMHGKFNVTGNFSNGEYVLEITNVTTADQGDYTCDIVVDGKPLQHTVKLELEQPPKQMAIQGSDNVDQVHGTEGQLLTLTCTVKNGYPGETLLWASNGTVVKVGGPRILILEWFAKRSDHLQNYTCMANNTAMQEPLERTIQLDIAYKPFLSTNDSNEIKSLEGQSLYVTCDQSSNPPSSEPKWWYVDAIGITRLFSNSHILYIKVITRRDTGIYICEASNTIGTGSTNISIDVYYPPSVHIDYNNYTENENRRELLCVSNGNPDTYTFSRWEHNSEFGEHIRFIDGYTNGSLVLPSTQTKSYQDSGFYVCTVSNGVPDTHGQVNQSNDAFLSVRGKPVFLESSKRIFYGIIDEPTYIRLEVYSVPKVTDIQLKDINGAPLNRQREAVITDEPALLRLRFHNTLVKSNGYLLKIQFSTFSEKDVGKYTMDIGNSYGKDTTNFTIQAASPPSIPINFSVTPLVNDVFVNWLKNFDGGLEQTFFIEYQVEGNINWISVKSLNSSASAELSWQISGLLSTQTYFFRMFARNALGESNKTAIRIIQMKGKEKGMFTIFAVISSAGVVFIILLPAVICICIRNRCSGEVSGNRPRTITTDGPSIYDEIPSDHIPENFVPTYTNEPNDESGPRIRIERQLETNSDVYISGSEVHQVNDDYLEPWVKRQSVSDSCGSGSDVCETNTYYLHPNVKRLSVSESGSCNSGSDIYQVNNDYLHPYVSLQPNWKEISKAQGLYMQQLK